MHLGRTIVVCECQPYLNDVKCLKMDVALFVEPPSLNLSHLIEASDFRFLHIFSIGQIG